MANAVATAASTALPPFLRTSRPTSAPGGETATTMPCSASFALLAADRLRGPRTRTAGRSSKPRLVSEPQQTQEPAERPQEWFRCMRYLVAREEVVPRQSAPARGGGRTRADVRTTLTQCLPERKAKSGPNPAQLFARRPEKRPVRVVRRAHGSNFLLPPLRRGGRGGNASGPGHKTCKEFRRDARQVSQKRAAFPTTAGGQGVVTQGSTRRSHRGKMATKRHKKRKTRGDRSGPGAGSRGRFFSCLFVFLVAILSALPATVSISCIFSGQRH